ncbi:hypothetical protein FDJ25_gp155 [Vibrio phage Aphrodite1]|uniref:Uncharacterized protein n=3 Tax=Aphroditevirus TaxID=2560092 RepID=A0A2I7QI72_9CAUD|nr:hypothetical protein FDJ25_gp155 [Vibrio phage Aphrodite1]YP_009847771.1 hypothetical protein HWC35_gp035 [Vibrio phage USC-1]AUR81096.1 hypothetical protein Aphrodite1_0046 [Vibrio phage Aphrodite1]QCW23299.1 hypothetical protein [Vibrio phage 5 TSL-2019]QDH47429.1 hypothetical protein [Vibrio phage USC-1]
MSNTKAPVSLRGTYDPTGVIQCDQNGTEEISVVYNRVQNHLQASVCINGETKAFVTFGINGERAVNTFVQGYGDQTRLEQSIQNIMSAVH